MGRQYVRQSSASASCAFCCSLPRLAAERIRLQRVVTNSRASSTPCRPVSPFTREHCSSRAFIQAETVDSRSAAICCSGGKREICSHSGGGSKQHRFAIIADGGTRSTRLWTQIPEGCPGVA